MAKTKDLDDLALIVADSLNKTFKDRKVAYVGKDEETPTDLLDFVSTGCTSLDLAISNRPHGGIPFGRIIELSGLEGSGKSLISAHIMANTQALGGVAVLIDTEAAVNWEFFEAVGVDRTKNFVYAAIETVEDVFEAVTNIITSIREKNKDRPVVIVIDSIAGASSKFEMESTFDKIGFNTSKAQIIGSALRKLTGMIAKQKVALIITNQLRQKMNAMPFSDPWVTPGGKSLAFHSSLRIRLGQAGTISRKTSTSKEVLGVKVVAKVLKNRLGPPLRTAEFEVYFDRGIDDRSSWLKFLRDKGIVTGRANALTYDSDNGEEYKFNESEWAPLLEDYPDLEEELYTKVCQLYIMQYNSTDLTSDQISIDESSED